jgi:hypothetical protein
MGRRIQRKPGKLMPVQVCSKAPLRTMPMAACMSG